jgi:hypothetical protein
VRDDEIRRASEIASMHDDGRRTEVEDEELTEAATVGEMLNHLDGAGLVITDTELLSKSLSYYGMTLDTTVCWREKDAA